MDFNNITQYGIDCMYKIIQNSFKPYKLMTIYSINPDKNISNIVALISIKYTDSESLIKLLSLL